MNFTRFFSRIFRTAVKQPSYKKIKLVSSFTDVPQDTGNTIFIVANGKDYKWALFQCPNRCGKRIEVNLMKSKYPKWRLKIRDNTISLSPSVRVSSCGAHFWLDNNCVEWAVDNDV
jgi:hypothetical protein